jgi:hypothetical protein
MSHYCMPYFTEWYMNMYPEDLPKKCYRISNFNSHGYTSNISSLPGLCIRRRKKKRTVNHPVLWVCTCDMHNRQQPEYALAYCKLTEKSLLPCHLVMKYWTNWSIIPREIVVVTIVFVSSEWMIGCNTCLSQLNDFIGAVRSVLQPSNQLLQNGAPYYIMWPGNGWYIMLHESSDYLQCLLTIS